MEGNSCMWKVGKENKMIDCSRMRNKKKLMTKYE